MIGQLKDLVPEEVLGTRQTEFPLWAVKASLLRENHPLTDKSVTHKKVNAL